MASMILRYCLILVVTSSACSAQQVSFTKDVRPILSDACFRCHGPDKETREADLRVDQHDQLLADRGGYSVVVPGEIAKSELIARIETDDPDTVMPPAHANKDLTAVQKDILRRWVQQGAEWEQHWAFVPPVKPPVPSGWQQQISQANGNEVDSFLMQRIDEAGLKPAEEAEPFTLLRRLYLDLIGLPPSVEDADKWHRRIWPEGTRDSFQIDQWKNLIVELQSSVHYAERWARRWLDLARYADTNGYEKDRDRTIWPYRDWVINAINSDMPFDQFTVEQLAGDMLADATTSQIIATGFHRNTMLNEEGGIDPLEFRYHAVVDRVATTGTTWLGLTLGCCQCHTHKYDPITHTEYFQIFSYFNNSDEPTLQLQDSATAQRWQNQKAKAAEQITDRLAKWTATDDADCRKWLEAEKQHSVGWRLLKPDKATSNLPLLSIESDGSVFASGDTAKRDDYWVTLSPLDQQVTSIRLEALPDDRLPESGPGSTYYEGTLGDFFLNEIKVSVDGQAVDVASASHSFAKNRFGKNPASAQLATDGDVQTGWSVHGRQGERHVAVFQLKQAIPAGQPITIQMTFGRHFASSLGRFRFSAAQSEQPPEAREYSDSIAKQIQAYSSLVPVSETFKEAWLLHDSVNAEFAAEIQKLRKRPRNNSTLVMSERPVSAPRTTYRHHRGEYLQPEEKVTSGLPDFLAARSQPRNRLEFARWLTSRDNPLTARVVVNRHWAYLFGTGIVKTVDDFGLQGDSPSHPALLDWLATTFMDEDAWSIRKLHLRICSSAAYRRSALRSETAWRIDPSNRLLSASPRFRRDAEVIRDQALKASGLLSDKVGGPSVRPPQPAGITEVAFGSPKWNADTNENRYRRSLYTYAKRTAPFAMLATFDAPTGESCVARRNRSNSPLQALTLLNDVMMIDVCQQAAAQLVTEAESIGPRETLRNVFRALLVRPPTTSELNELTAFLQEQVSRSLSERMREREIEGWTMTFRAILALDEALTRE